MMDEERKQKNRERQRKYLAEHPEYAEKQRERAKKYYWEHRDEKKAYNRQYQKEHSLIISDEKHRYYIEHKEEIRARQKRYRAEKVQKEEADKP